MKFRSLLFLLLLISVTPLVAQDGAECEEGFRVFVDARGEVCVPEAPQRIVATHDINAGLQVLSLGGPLVGMASRYGEFAPDITQFFDLSEMEDIGQYYEPSIERVLALQPDLIVHEGYDGTLYYSGEGMLELLEAIAPVVAIDAFRPVEEVMADYQNLLGESVTIPLAGQQAEFEAVVDEIRAVLGEGWQNVTVSQLIGGEGELAAWGPTAMVPNDILTRVGVSWVAPQMEAGLPENGGYLGGFSYEQFDLFSADLILIDTTTSTELFDHPLVQQLPAVQAGQVILLDEPYFGNHYPNYIAVAKRLLADLQTIENFDTGIIDEPDTPAVITSCEAGFRLFDHQYLATDPVCIPENPQRIVVAWPFNVAALLRAGVPIVGTTDIAFNQGQFPEWQEELGALTDVGNPLNLEVVLGLQPDLIITAAFSAGDNPETLTSIAPTVLFTWDGTHIWQDVAKLMFDATGKLDVFDVLGAEEEARAAELGGLIGDPAEVELSIVNVRADRIILYTQYSPGGMIVEDVGFSRPEIQLLPVTPDEYFADEEAYPDFGAPYLGDISLEQLQRADGDYILIFGDFNLDADAQATLDELLANPLWQTLEAVQEGKVYISSVNFAGGDISNIHAMLDELAEAFGVAAELSPNPYVTKAGIPE